MLTKKMDDEKTAKSHTEPHHKAVEVTPPSIDDIIKEIDGVTKDPSVRALAQGLRTEATRRQTADEIIRLLGPLTYKGMAAIVMLEDYATTFTSGEFTIGTPQLVVDDPASSSLGLYLAVAGVWRVERISALPKSESYKMRIHHPASSIKSEKEIIVLSETFYMAVCEQANLLNEALVPENTTTDMGDDALHEHIITGEQDEASDASVQGIENNKWFAYNVARTNNHLLVDNDGRAYGVFLNIGDNQNITLGFDNQKRLVSIEYDYEELETDGSTDFDAMDGSSEESV